MKKIILIISILSVLVAACSNKATAPKDKPLTSNVPSDDKTKKEGTPLSQWKNDSKENKSIAINASVSANTENTKAADGFNLLERLYSTTWYQSESDYDDGKLETEETFVFFNEKSEMIEREYENGKIDGRDDYAALEWIEDIAIPSTAANKDRNACIVRNTEKGKYENDTEYEGYYLADRDTLYIVDGDNIDAVKGKLEKAIRGQADPEDKFVLSTKQL